MSRETIEERILRLLDGPRGPVDPFSPRTLVEELYRRSSSSVAARSGVQRTIMLTDELSVGVDPLGGPLNWSGPPPHPPLDPLVRTLALAEARAALRPNAPWVIDAALAATALVPVAPALAPLAHKRTGQAVRWLRDVPEQVFVREAVMTVSRLRHELAPLRAFAADELDAWHAAVRAARPPARATTPASSVLEPVLLARRIRTAPLAPELHRSGLVAPGTLLELWEDDTGVTASITLRPDVAVAAREAKSVDAGLAAIGAFQLRALLGRADLREPWVLPFLRGTSKVLDPVQLALHPLEARLAAALSPRAADDGVVLATSFDGTADLDPARLVDEAIAAAPFEVADTSRYLLLMATATEHPEVARAGRALADAGDSDLDKIAAASAAADLTPVSPLEMRTVAAELLSALQLELQYATGTALNAAKNARENESVIATADETLALVDRVRWHMT